MPDVVSNQIFEGQLSNPQPWDTHHTTKPPEELENPLNRNYDLTIKSGDSLIIDGISTDEVGLYVDTPPMPPMPHRTVTTYSIPGRSESLVKKRTLYEDIELNFSCYLFNYGYNPEKIYRMIANAQALSFSAAPWYYWRVKDVGGIKPSYAGKGKQRITVSFTCSPFRYSTDETPLVLAGNGSTRHYFQTYGNVFSEPLYVIKGINIPKQTDEIADVGFVLTVNGYQAGILETLPENVKDIYIDVERRLIYTLENGEMKTIQELTQGAFWKLYLVPDEKAYNSLQWSGATFDTLEIYKRERWI